MTALVSTPAGTVELAGAAERHAKITVAEFDPTVLQSRSGRDGRSLTADVPTSDPGVVLEIFTAHDKDRREYRTSVFAVRVTREETCTIRGLNIPQGVRTLTQKQAGARFSAKNLDAAHREHLLLAGRRCSRNPDGVTEFLSHAPRD